MLSKQKIKQKVNQWTPGDEGEGKERCIIKQHEKNLANVGYVHYLDYDGGLTGITNVKTHEIFSLIHAIF